MQNRAMIVNKILIKMYHTWYKLCHSLALSSTKHFTMTTFAFNSIDDGGFSGVPGIIRRQRSDQMNIELSNVIGSSSSIKLSKNSPKTAGICLIFSNLQVY